MTAELKPKKHIKKFVAEKPFLCVRCRERIQVGEMVNVLYEPVEGTYCVEIDAFHPECLDEILVKEDSE